MRIHSEGGGRFVWIKADPDDERGYTVIYEGTFWGCLRMPRGDGRKTEIDVVWGLATEEAPNGHVGEKILKITCPDSHIHIAKDMDGKWMCAGHEDSCPGKWEVGYSSKKGGVAIRLRLRHTQP